MNRLVQRSHTLTETLHHVYTGLLSAFSCVQMSGLKKSRSENNGGAAIDYFSILASGEVKLKRCVRNNILTINSDIVLSVPLPAFDSLAIE